MVMGLRKADPAVGASPLSTAAPAAAASGAPAATPGPAANDTAFDQLLALVRRDAGTDALREREGALRRRIARRRHLLHLPSEQAYLDHLRSHPDEMRLLHRSLSLQGAAPARAHGLARPRPGVEHDAPAPAAREAAPAPAAASAPAELRRQIDERNAAAKHAEALLRLVLESTADGLLGVDLAGRISLVNAAACQMLGVDRQAALGLPAIDTLRLRAADGQPLGLGAHPVARALHTGRASRFEGTLHGCAGAVLPVAVEVRPMRQGDEVVGAVVSLHDASERIAAERAREAALAEAHRLAQVRTEFLTNMSHEIRTPLNAILGLAEVAARGDRDHTPEQTFARILDAGQLLLGVVNDVLDFAKIEAGKLQIEWQPVELGSVIDRAVALVAPRVYAKGLRFAVNEAPDLPRCVQADALRLTQVLGNLLSNALKFTERGGIELRAWCDLHDLWFAVHDSGIGIAPEQMPRLFQPFEQVDASTTRRVGGSGLGLVISRHLMELMGGAISVRSTPGGGSTFSLRLPLQGAEPAPATGTGQQVVLAGLCEVDHVTEALLHLGLAPDCRSPEAAFEAPHAPWAVLDVAALQDETLRGAAVAALDGGTRIAVLTHPLSPELPEVLRGRVTLLEGPLRARHVAAWVLAPDAQPEHAGASAHGGRLAGLRVLAAEDNEVNALVLEAVMRMEGAALMLVGTGRLAVERVAAAGPGHFDLVLSDIQMPEMDGYAATRAILRLDPTLPVVGLTAHAMPEERERCREAGMVDHLAKPIEVERLVATVLARRRPRTPES
jgi:PAS domain S-box-containing protein